ncbi:hypothetical protein KUTG_08142 [Kutzneria sp. 744]|nr:hypothetical protein KUTG_08142 [Kutzneria sp. 744]
MQVVIGLERSSPLTRGPRNDVLVLDLGNRSSHGLRGDDVHRGVETAEWHRDSPACAGTTRRTCRTCGSRAEQPRLRGDDQAVACNTRTAAGTAPPARGRPDVHAERAEAERNSPACAGTTLVDLRRCWMSWHFSFGLVGG